MLYLSLAAAPVIIILIFIYVKDKYNKEPLRVLIRCFVGGLLSIIPIYLLNLLTGYFNGSFSDKINILYNSFVQAAFVEEGVKFALVMLLTWHSKYFDEKFDGIVYAVFVSMGFALVENILYVTSAGAGVGLLRAFTTVPAHAIFGINMGYYIGLAKYNAKKRKLYLFLAFFISFLLHGFFNLIVMIGVSILLLGFIFYVMFLYNYGIKKINELSKYKEKSGTVTTEAEKEHGVEEDVWL
jgi:RsiW-degrading membrane proteinase PrsW (M82 family)